MTYQNLTEKHDDNADEASPLLLTKKKHGVSMRAMIATTFFFLGSLAVIYYGRGSSSSSSNTNRHDGTSAALLLGHYQAATQEYDPYVYDPSQDDCYADADNAGKYCYFPCREYNIVNNHYVINKKCPNPVCEYAVPCGNWDRVTDADDDNCGIPCTINCGVQSCVLPTLYDPKRDFCFTDLSNKNKYCWYPTDHTPVGNWKGVTGAAYNGCGAKCDKVQHYDPSGSYPNGCDCFQDIDNPGKYCWLYDTGYRPYGNWKNDGKHAYDDCGPMCTDY